MEQEKLVERAGQIGQNAKKVLSEIQTKHPKTIGEIRAERGAMIAMELVRDGDAQQPDADLTKRLVAKACENGLILLSCGVNGNVIRLLPALTIPEDILAEGLAILETSLADCL
jgi:4-aminobutyrate aminotransferase/(S)-3-amino-2-methylpropionate transaminase